MTWDLIFKYVEFPSKCLYRECEHLVTVPDMFDTGDSPTGYECGAPRWTECPYWEEAQDEHVDRLFD